MNDHRNSMNIRSSGNTLGSGPCRPPRRLLRNNEAPSAVYPMANNEANRDCTNLVTKCAFGSIGNDSVAMHRIVFLFYFGNNIVTLSDADKNRL